MPLLSEVKYESGINNFKSISSQKVLSMLKDVRAEIGKLESLFNSTSLKEVLAVIEKGAYKVNGDIQIRVNLSGAKRIIEFYRENSEGGCQSCRAFTRDIFNDDMDSFCYCDVKEDAEQTPKKCGYNAGFSPLIKKYYHTPCEVWNPHFSPTLDELVKRE